MKEFTCRTINLKGNPNSPEAAQHIITFPGGSIEVSRTENNEYWVHIAVHKKELLDEVPHLSKHGLIIDSRIDREYPHNNIDELPDMSTIEHLAVRIKTMRGE